MEAKTKQTRDQKQLHHFTESTDAVFHPILHVKNIFKDKKN